MIVNGVEVSLEEAMNTPAVRQLIAYGEETERFYLKVESHLPPEDFSQELLDRMNVALGFEPGYKGQDYRPYCGRCTRGPRMIKIRHGFYCWSCKQTWDLRTDEEKAQSKESTHG